MRQILFDLREQFLEKKEYWSEAVAELKVKTLCERFDLSYFIIEPECEASPYFRIKIHEKGFSKRSYTLSFRQDKVCPFNRLDAVYGEFKEIY